MIGSFGSSFAGFFGLLEGGILALSIISRMRVWLSFNPASSKNDWFFFRTSPPSIVNWILSTEADSNALSFICYLSCFTFYCEFVSTWSSSSTLGSYTFRINGQCFFGLLIDYKTYCLIFLSPFDSSFEIIDYLGSSIGGSSGIISG